MKLTLDALLVLDAINREGSFAATAEALNRVPSAITYTMKKLEQDLDVMLFDRSGHRAVLTEPGRTLLEEGRYILEAACNLEKQVKKVAEGWEMELTIALNGILPSASLLPLIDEFYQLQSGTRIRLIHEVYGGLWDALASNRADLSIGAPQDGPSGGGYQMRPLTTFNWIFAVAKDHPLAHQAEPLTEQDISQYRVIAVADTSRSLPPRTAGIITGQDVFTVADIQTKICAHIQGLGVGYLPRNIIQYELNKGLLVEKNTEVDTINVSTCLAWRSGTIGHSLQWFLDHIDESTFAGVWN